MGGGRSEVLSTDSLSSGRVFSGSGGEKKEGGPFDAKEKDGGLVESTGDVRLHGHEQ